MLNMLRAPVIIHQSQELLVLCEYNFGQKEKAMLDLSKPIISNSDTLIALRGSKVLGLVSHILKPNVLPYLKKHVVLPCTSRSTSQQTQNPRHPAL